MNAEATATGSAAAIEHKPKKPSMRAGYICLAVAVFAIFALGVFGWLLAAPLALAALVIGIIGISKGNTARGVVLAVAAFIVPAVAQAIQLALTAAVMADRLDRLTH